MFVIAYVKAPGLQTYIGTYMHVDCCAVFGLKQALYQLVNQN